MAETQRALIGTYTAGRTSLGVYLVDCAANGSIVVRDVLASDDPSFIVLHPRLPLAYTVNERVDTPGGLTVLALQGDRIAPVATQSLAGELPCHLALLPDASGLVVAHYGCGTVQWLGLDAHGSPDGRSASIRHVGSGLHPRRQASAHAHCVLPIGEDIYVADLGLDAVVQHRLHRGAPGSGVDSRLVEQSRCAIHAGAGPRHLCAAADGRTLWLCNELDNSVSTLRRAADGSLTEAGWTGTLPPGSSVRSATSEIALHPAGRWLYVGNRGHDSLVRLELDVRGVPQPPLPDTAWVASGGVHPRHFALAPDGLRLLAANRDPGSLQAFVVDAGDGSLRPLGAPCMEVPAPVCVRWLR